MSNISQLLKEDEDKVLALLDKMVNMTEHCQRVIMKSIHQLRFAEETIKKEKSQFNNDVDEIWRSKPDPCNTVNFNL